MKYIIILASLLLAANSKADVTNNFTFASITNGVPQPQLQDTNVPVNNYGKYDLTLGGDAFVNTHKGDNGFEFDVSLSTDPFKSIPNLWIGIEQGIGWEPRFTGSTDLSLYYSFDIYKGSWFFNPGWSGGAVYGGSPLTLRSGPLAEFQYYITDAVFIYNDTDYDLIQSHGHGGIRNSFGIGFEW